MSTSRPPAISVVMPVRDGEPFLDEAIRSVLDQTFADFELVVLDDASTDGSGARIAAWAERDRRVRPHGSPRRLGVANGSNAVTALARASLVARMDADDVSHPDRLRRQHALLSARPEAVAVGTLAEGIDAAGRVVRPRDRWRILRRSRFVPFPHGSVMFRRLAFEAVGGYDPRREGEEDQDLFRRLAARGSVMTLPEALYRYRYHLENTSLSATVGGEAADDFYRLAMMRLWAGDAPGVLRRFCADGRLRRDPRAWRALACAGWGDVSPATLRLALRLFIRGRDVLSGLGVRSGEAHEWRPASARRAVRREEVSDALH